MVSREPRAKRMLGLWTATWLFALLLAGILWVGDLSLQWPVLLVPVLWALVALRPRRRREIADDGWEPIPPPMRTDTVERSAVRRRGDQWESAAHPARLPRHRGASTTVSPGTAVTPRQRTVDAAVATEAIGNQLEGHAGSR